jgi:hypothetical protein
MIVFDLECRAGGHRFEGWFGSSLDFADQHARGLLDCPQCGSLDIAKAPMAPRLARKGNQRDLAVVPPASERGAPQPDVSEPSTPAPPVPAPGSAPPTMPPQVIAAMHALAAMQAEALRRSRWVGERFADDVRAMHYGEQDEQAVHGQATAEEAQELLEEGITILPLPFPVAPPDELN